eukprot:PhF_6_TR13223/c0_g1_i1/m.20912
MTQKNEVVAFRMNVGNGVCTCTILSTMLRNENNNGWTWQCNNETFSGVLSAHRLQAYLTSRGFTQGTERALKISYLLAWEAMIAIELSEVIEIEHIARNRILEYEEIYRQVWRTFVLPDIAQGCVLEEVTRHSLECSELSALEGVVRKFIQNVCTHETKSIEDVYAVPKRKKSHQRLSTF